LSDISKELQLTPSDKMLLDKRYYFINNF